LIRSSDGLAPSRVGIIIPARFASTRFPGKPLARLRGADGVQRSLIEHSWRAATAVPQIDSVWVATDDERIGEEVERFGGEVVMTPPDCANGTERCAAALQGRSNPPDIIVNLQGDAPLTPAVVVTTLVERLRADPQLPVATPAVRCSHSVYRHLTADQDAGRVGGTTVVFDAMGDALYFSKRVIPYLDTHKTGEGELPVFLHLGVYAYRRDALLAYSSLPMSILEQVEGLEQLRFLDAGMKVGIAVCDRPDWDVIELNNPTDVAQIEAMLEVRGSVEDSQ
jgi:3-deoxy-manno-octulosonate cytidylyltransferase (CMP-KDO synthetase)